MQEMEELWVWSLGWEDPLEEEVTTHSCILAWEIPWIKEPHRLVHGSQRVGHDWVYTLMHLCTYKMFSVVTPACSLGPGLGKGLFAKWSINMDVFKMPDMTLRVYTLISSYRRSYLSICFAAITRGIRAEILLLGQSAAFMGGQNMHCFTWLISRPHCCSLRWCLVSVFSWAKCQIYP